MIFFRGRAWWSVLALGGASLSLGLQPGAIRQVHLEVSVRTGHGVSKVAHARRSAPRHAPHRRPRGKSVPEAGKSSLHLAPTTASSQAMAGVGTLVTPTTMPPATTLLPGPAPTTKTPDATAATASAPPPASLQPAGAATLATHWIIAASALQDLIDSGGAGIARSTFDNPTTVILGSSSGISTWSFNRGISAKSLSEVEAAAAATPRADTVLYDPEDWSFTPTTEQLNPFAASQSAQTFAAGAHMSLISAPALDLMKVLYPGISPKTAYISEDVPGQLARVVSTIEIQAQSLEASPATYAAFVRAAVAEARAVNPAVRVYAGLSTNPDGQTVTSQELYKDVQATLGDVYGYWLNVPSGGAYCPSCGTPQPQVAIDLLTELRG